MNAALEYASVLLLVAVMLLSPVGLCVENMQAANMPEHPCCPKAPSAPQTCASPGCVCSETNPAVFAVTVYVDRDPVFLAEESESLVGTVVLCRESTVQQAPRSSGHRFVPLHQFLI
jgi:hypothetical protein